MVVALEAMTVAETLTTTEATTVLVIALVARRERFTTSEAARRVGMSRAGAYRLLSRASRTGEIVCVKGWWQRAKR